MASYSYNTGYVSSDTTILNANSDKAIQPEKIVTKMKPHQLTMLQACKTLEETSEKDNYGSLDNDSIRFNTRMGIICDLVGSGKTLSILSLIADKPKIITTQKRISAGCQNLINYQYLLDNKDDVKTIPINIIVVPHTIVLQWNAYITANTQLKHLIIYNKKSMEKFIECGKDYYKELDILLISSTRYREVYKYLTYKQEYIYRLIFDEVDTISISSLTNFNAHFYWFISSTVYNLFYPYGAKLYQDKNSNFSDHLTTNYNIKTHIPGLANCGFLKDTFRDLRHVNKNVRKRIFIRNDLNYTKQSFLLPKPIVNLIKCQSPVTVQILNGLVSKEVLDCINAGNTAGAIEAMHCDTVSDETNVVTAFTKHLQVDLDNKKLLLQMKSQMTYANENSKKLALENIKNRIALLETQIENIKIRVTSMESCPICMSKIEDKTVTGCCNNSFCFECLMYAIGSNTSQTNSSYGLCPMCRANIDNKGFIVVNEGGEASAADETEKLHDKIYMFKKIVSDIFKNSDNKLIVFSNYDNSFYELQSIMYELGVKYSRISGTTISIKNIINRFNKTDTENIDKIDTLFLNSNYCGSGLNLEKATHVIIYHNLNKEKSVQVIGRAQRPGRKEPLTIYRMAYENEIEKLSDISTIVD